MADAANLSVLIGADSLALRRSGVGRMTLEITRAARACAQIDHAELLVGDTLTDAGLIDRLDHGAGGVHPTAPVAWKVRLGGVPGVQVLRRIKNGGLHRRVKQLERTCSGMLVYHEPNMIPRPIHLPTVVTMNDLSWHHEPSWHPAERLLWIDRNMKRTLRQADRFAAISQFTRNAVIRELGVPASQIDVIPLAPAEEFVPVSAADAAPVLARFGLEDKSYVFSISTLEPRKNFDRLLAAHLSLAGTLRAHAPLVIAGGKGWGDVLARPEAETAIRDGSVRLLGHVADDDLVVLCARAGVFAYVSLYEGFGLPVVEAMATGCPVVASSTTSVGEVAGGAALLVDPMDVESIAAGLRRVLEDPALAAQLGASGVARAATFTWARTIQTLVGCWRKALP